jgi:hypothetical protein
MKLDFFVLPNTNQSVMPVPPFNYCDMTRGHNSIPVLGNIMRSVFKSDELPMKCPYRNGFYSMQNISLDISQLPKLAMLKKTTRVLCQLVFKDENGKKPVTIYKYQIYVVVYK